MGILEDLSGLAGLPAYVIVAVAFLVAGVPERAWQLIAALAILYAIVVPIRYFFFHNRPKPMKHDNSFVEKFIANTLVSIHTARATILAFTLIVVFKSLPATILFGSIIPIVATSRILMQKHRLIDVVTGFLVGGWIAIAVLNFF